MDIERERELKLDVDEDTPLGDLAAGVPGAALGEVEDRRLVATYYDTADLRLARWGCTVRHRNDAGWVVKLPVPGAAADGAVVRDEVAVPADGLLPPAAASALVSALRRGSPLARVATMTTDRRAHVFRRGGDGSPVIELVDDRVEVVDAGGAVRRFRELEIELLDDDADADPLQDALLAAGARPSTSRSKLVRGLGPAADGPPDVVVPPVSEWPTGREVTHAALAGAVAHLLLHLPHARAGAVLGVHQSRVAIRRLRSDLSTFRDLLDPHWAERVQPELKWLGGQLGHVRDDDVLLAKLAPFAGSAALLPIYRRHRDEHREALLDALDGDRATILLDELVAAAHDPPTSPQADDPAADLLRPLVRRRWHRLRAEAKALGAHPADDELHAVRILAKRCRYAVEAVAPAFGPEARASAKDVAKLQDALGELNDAAVIGARLAATPELIPAEAFAAGRIAGELASRGDAQRDAWRPEWKRMRSPERWSWL